jgi:hypothetical protein
VPEAIAAVELIISEPATNAPITCFNPWLAILSSGTAGIAPHRRSKPLVHREVAFHRSGDEFLGLVARSQH